MQLTRFPDACSNTQAWTTLYRHFTQVRSLGGVTFELKTAASEASVVASIRRVLRSIDSDLPLYEVRTQTEQIDATLSSERIFAALTSGFGLLAVILAAVGVYGVMAYAVTRRTGEIGVRMALGAEARQVLKMILRESLLLTAAGTAFGLLSAAALTRLVRAMLYGVTPYDPVTLAGAIVVLLAVALGAAWWPARRASRLNPLTALRNE